MVVNVISSRMPWDWWLILFVLGVVVPWRGRARLRELLAKSELGSADRVRLYVSTITFQWVATIVVGWRAAAHGLTTDKLGLSLAMAERPKVLAVGVGGAVALAVLQVLNLRRMGRADSGIQGSLQNLARKIFPRTQTERAAFLLLGITAGVCEEFLYRGFAMAAFPAAGLPMWLAVLASAGLFGLAHLYQGRGGAVGTFLMGILFGAVRNGYHSLVPVMLWHAAVDIAAGLAGSRYFVTNAPGEPQAKI